MLLYKNTFLKDYERPLKKSGIEDIKQIGQYLKLKQHTPDYILTSGAQRTLESAKFLSSPSSVAALSNWSQKALKLFIFCECLDIIPSLFLLINNIHFSTLYKFLG